ncbi:hypothetical protein PX699_16770 [Sphingobium sp. H39-3-25]|uniref:hypothetical protein n=1 Tax=Sphingomonadales TaxID=204457 RepID=UPI000833494D|nr:MULTISPECIES: hypothetical protein [Sphingomonadaceae]MDF0491457.1 hypothetical protein [Sphingomonas pollutisoli]MDF0544007.1 hypothetical protein [Sphingobium arseniciresistens]
MTEPDDDMWRALVDFRARHGRRWKDQLSMKWMNGQDESEPLGGSLRRVRNHLGPSWLCDLEKSILDAAERRLANLAKLPEMCAAHLPGTDEPIVIKRGEKGYWPMPDGMTIEAINATFDATPAQITAMQAGSMFGWDVPGADPDRYDADGNLLHSARR